MSHPEETSTTSTASVEPSPDDEPVPPFFNTTFSTHRVSPLYVGTETLTPARLTVLGRRLRDTLVGDVVRGIQISLESTDTAAGQVGPLRSVSLRWFSANTVLGDEVDYRGDGGDTEGVWNALSESQKQGLWIEIRHENAAYVAILLPAVGGVDKSKTPVWHMQPGQTMSGQSATDDGRFVHLPLMLLRMPMPLKTVISEWISTTFDCRVSKLALGSKTIVNVWEDWIRTIGVSSRGLDFIITLGFNAPLADPVAPDDRLSDDETAGDETMQPGLRSLEITIPPQELGRFVRAGTSQVQRPRKKGSSWESDPRERRRLAGGNTDDGWDWLRQAGAAEQPFTNALAHYLDHHIALNMFHPSVKVIQISCGGFILGSSRLKVVGHGEMSDDMSRSAWMFVTRLGDRVKGEGLPAIFT